ncbi:MAG: carboxypeptidase-like regulatory domain-containing protein, partial [Sphingobacterium hotanense]
MMQNLYYSLFMICALIFYGQRSEAKSPNSLNRNYLNSYSLKSLSKLDSIKITGKVTDANGAALEGVVITEKNTTNSAISDKDGAYSLSAGAVGTLVFLKSGFQTKEVQVNNQKEIMVNLSAGEDKPETTVEQDTSRKEVTDTVATQAPEANVQTPSTHAQGTVTGTVSGPSGPLAGVTVQVQGTTVTTSTDQEGKFEIAAS